MAYTTIAVDVNQSLDILSDLTAQVAFDDIVPGNEIPETANHNIIQDADACALGADHSPSL
jgi:hypothetical protein